MINVKLLTAKANIGDPVRNKQGEVLGKIKDILFDNKSMEVIFAVMDFSDKEFAIPYSNLTFIGEEGYFLLDAPYAVFKDSSDGFHFEGKFYFRYSH